MVRDEMGGSWAAWLLPGDLQAQGEQLQPLCLGGTGASLAMFGGALCRGSSQRLI